MFLHMSVILLTGGGLQAHTQKGGWGSGWGVSKPIPRGEVEGSGQRGVSRPRWSRPGGVCVPQHALWQTNPHHTATSADGTHPTGMHSLLDI